MQKRQTRAEDGYTQFTGAGSQAKGYLNMTATERGTVASNKTRGEFAMTSGVETGRKGQLAGTSEMKNQEAGLSYGAARTVNCRGEETVPIFSGPETGGKNNNL